MQNIYKRIEFWLLIFFFVRLIGITNPPLEIGHNWRQVTGLMVTRNFLEVNSNILYPRVDDNGGQSGIIGMEFPFMNYLHYIFAKIFGYADWYGRLLNLLLSTFGIFYFYRLIKRYADEQTALFSSMILLSSIWFCFSRKTMPDTACISLMFIGGYYGLAYFADGKFKDIVLYTLICGLALLVKIPAGIYLSIFALPLLSSKHSAKTKLIWSLATGLILAVTYLWYFVWNPYLSETFGTWYNSGKPLFVGFMEIVNNLDQVSEKFYFSSFHSYGFFVSFLIGIFLVFKKKEKAIIYTLALVGTAFLVYIFKSGYFFYHHEYYIIPFVPVMALIAGYFLSQIKNKWFLGVVLAGGIIEAVANQQHDLFIKPSEKYKMSLESVADSVSNKKDLILINGNGNPQEIYLAHRKGWLCDDNQLTDKNYIQDIANKGCRYIFVDKHSMPNDLMFEKVFSNNDYCVYRLNPSL